jgi:hypothetical protein
MAQYHIPVKDRLLHGLSTKDEGIFWNKFLINSSRRKQKNSLVPSVMNKRINIKSIETVRIHVSWRVSRIRDGSSPPNCFNYTNEVNKF